MIRYSQTRRYPIKSTTSLPRWQATPWMVALILVLISTPCFAQTKSKTQDATIEKETTGAGYFLLGDDGGYLGASIKMRGTVENPKPGHTYQLRYLIRVQQGLTSKGDFLGDKQHPNGVCYTVQDSAKDQPQRKGMLRFYDEIDINRTQIRKMYNFPKVATATKVILRVEPQIFDVTSDKYIGDDNPEAIILIAHARKGGYVTSLQTVSGYIKNCKSCGQAEFEKMIWILKNMGRCDDYGNQISDAIAQVLDWEHLSEAKQLQLLETVLPEWLDMKVGYSLNEQLDKLADSGNAQVKKAAERLIKIRGF